MIPLNNLGIFLSLKFRILMEKILRIPLKTKFHSKYFGLLCVNAKIGRCNLHHNQPYSNATEQRTYKYVCTLRDKADMKQVSDRQRIHVWYLREMKDLKDLDVDRK